MTTARDIMKPGAQWISRDQSVAQAARVMAELGVGSLVIADENERMCGIITDRDIVVKCIAQGLSPSGTRAAELCEATPRWVSADADIGEVLDEMETRQIKRMPVIENKRLVGMISEADLARHLDDNQLGEFVTAVYGRP
ncbi:CBS domain-containing protein [Nocardia cyriacigeorgica]|uniref:CBS domain-containing protein n=1 Tax=Nocardia cyriacigeorgica TaxID=135487 RepID=A0A6P1DDD6_9NOCA|nr:CBS domain-containing protein [Nocardia cyriacigeorgica]NEW38353.1 CBS domain-containing protein [Nocardia cyriacigeorgica]NEW47621.1 CBS domain-containing protein [Nocardia cyriacigeorgica]NEW49296.1 CBS domain-containing protein [Nocardia cyriacigeorgica]NEW54217.1 CBS domain-containing protein [Nocardia cyriacigeorgica]